MTKRLTRRGRVPAGWAALAALVAAGASAQERAAVTGRVATDPRATQEVATDARAGGAQEVAIVSSAITLSSRADGLAELLIELSDGTEHRISFEDGIVGVDGERLGEVREDGRLAAAWRDFLRERLGESDADLRDALLAWRARGVSGAEAEIAGALTERLGRLLGASPPAAAQAPAAGAAPDGGQVSIAPGGVGFDALARELERLQVALAPLGEAARDAGDRLALVVHDDYAIPAGRSIGGNLALLDGTLRLEGTVEGDVLVLDGDLVLPPGGRIEGDLLQVGGNLRLEGGTVSGEILADLPVSPSPGGARVEVESPAPPVAAEAPRERGSRDRGPFARLTHNLGHALEGFVGAVSAFLTLAVLGLLAVYFARPRLETVADTLRHEFARSFAMGLAGQVLFFPALLVLCVLVITIPVIPFFILGTGIALAAGYLAAAHASGEMFAERRFRYEWLDRLRRSNSYYYVLNGLALLLLPFALASLLWVFGDVLDFLRGLLLFVACVGTWVLVTAGFGSVLLTRGGSRSIVVDWPADVAAEPAVEFAPEPGPTRSSGAPEPGPGPETAEPGGGEKGDA